VPTEWKLSPSGSAATPELSKTREAEAILKAVPDGAYVFLLDERGTALTTPQLAERLDRLAVDSVKSAVFIIGGAHGVDQAIRERADFVWSLSPLTFPHQLVRLLLAEQLYRAHTILRNLPYHHE
jgi:23S rRNA (pseudouridine1915-N3)-methyltransferase